MDTKVYVDPYPKIMKMLGLERINIDCGNNTSIVTPPNIAKDMVTLLPDSIFNPDSKFLDICCKCGIFLTSIRERLMNSPAMIEAIPDYEERYNYITNNQLYGISPNGQCQMYSVRAVYDTLKIENPHIVGFGAFEQYKTACLSNNHKFLYEEIIKMGLEFKEDFHFDAVIGNPPYNKGMDLDFVDLAYKLSSKYTCMITPAKWQTAEANQHVVSKMSYGEFRQKYVPHMSYVCFYPDCLDVFGIQESSGITYYLIDKDMHENKCTVKNSSQRQHKINSTAIRDITHQQSLWNIGNEIVQYLGKYVTYKFTFIFEKKYYTLNINTQLTKSTGSSGVWDWEQSRIRPDCIGKGGVLLGKNGNLVLTGGIRVLKKDQTSSSGTSKDIFTSDNIDECKSFYSWFDTKFVRFFVLINISSLTIINDNTFRFVPAPPSGKFDHIYTDEELYKAFNLPQKYIDVIEAIIKERK